MNLDDKLDIAIMAQSLGSSLHHLMKTSSYTLTKLSRKSGLTKTEIYEFMIGKSGDLRILSKCCLAMGYERVSPVPIKYTDTGTMEVA